MEALGSELIRSLALQGTGWLVSCLLAVLVLILLRKLRDSYLACMDQYKQAEALRAELQEKRIIEAKAYVEQLHEGTQANLELARSIAARSETLNGLIDVNRRIENIVSAMEKAVIEVLRRLEDIQGRTPR